MTEMTNRSSSKMDIKAGLGRGATYRKGKEETTGRQTKERQAARGRTEEKRRVK